MVQTHNFLSTNLNILSKMFVFFTYNEIDMHWWGWVAINPWLKVDNLLHHHKSTDDFYEDEYNSGLVLCDGITPDRKFQKSLCFIWFLNMASTYRDIYLDGKLGKMHNLNHIP